MMPCTGHRSQTAHTHTHTRTNTHTHTRRHALSAGPLQRVSCSVRASYMLWRPPMPSGYCTAGTRCAGGSSRELAHAVDQPCERDTGTEPMRGDARVTSSQAAAEPHCNACGARAATDTAAGMRDPRPITGEGGFHCVGDWGKHGVTAHTWKQAGAGSAARTLHTHGAGSVLA